MARLSIRFQCTKKAGTLARLIKNVLLVGLTYERHHIDTWEDDCEISIIAQGSLNCSREKLIEIFEELPDVMKVQVTEFSAEGDFEKAQVVDAASVAESRVSASELLTAEILLDVENKMTQIIGPVGRLLVESAAQSSRNVGELYAQLAEELDDEEDKNELLSSILF